MFNNTDTNEAELICLCVSGVGDRRLAIPIGCDRFLCALDAINFSLYKDCQSFLRSKLITNYKAKEVMC